MSGLLSAWVLRRVLKSALILEGEAIRTYQELRGKISGARRCSEEPGDSLCHLLAEEELHRRILMDAAAGRLSLDELEDLLKAHLYSGFADIGPLEEETLLEWKEDLSAALEHEEKTWVFYGNLRRMSRIPAVRKAFEVLASMEKEHVDVLRKLLGRV